MKSSYFVFIAIAVIIIIFIASSVKKSRLSIKESFWWMIGSIFMLILSIFPGLVNWAAKIFGVSYPPTILFVFCILFLIYMVFRNSKRIAVQQEKIVELSQQIAILKNKDK
ncbi:MAG: DUF2304 domain-containing protein [Bacilli bacterium]|nr:DUF2304 domain-containing protein [Bacilli bacterium]MBR3049359.1 DUF2304 domain-containing protein [Bacilli bacterium]